MALASCALVVEVTIATQWSRGPGCAYTRAQKHAHTYIHIHSSSPSHHAYVLRATGAPISIILPDFDWHTRGVVDHN